MGEQRFHELANGFDRPAAIAGRAAAPAFRARADAGLVMVPLRAGPPGAHDVIGLDLIGPDAAVPLGAPLRGDGRVDGGERRLGERARWAAGLAQHHERRALKVVALRTAPPTAAAMGGIDRVGAQIAVLVRVPQRHEGGAFLRERRRRRAHLALGARGVRDHDARRALKRVPGGARPPGGPVVVRGYCGGVAAVLGGVPEGPQGGNVGDGLGHGFSHSARGGGSMHRSLRLGGCRGKKVICSSPSPSPSPAAGQGVLSVQLRARAASRRRR